MIRAIPPKWIAHQIMRNPHMTHLRMRHPMEKPPRKNRPAADARADREIQTVLDTSRRAPPRLTQNRGVHIRIERNLHAESFPTRAGQIEIPPPHLRC